MLAADDVTVNTTDGGIVLTAAGAENGDISLIAADDVAITPTGALTLTVGGDLALAVTGNVTGNIQGDGTDTIIGYLAGIEIEAATSEQLLVGDSGKVFTNTAAQGATTFTLPDAAAGLVYIVHDCSATGADDVIVAPQAGDTIDGDSAGDGITNTADEASATVTLVALDGVRWVTVSSTGTWAAL